MGRVLDARPRQSHPLLFMCFAGIGGATMVIPFAHSLALLHVVVAAQGFFGGCVDSVVHPALAWLHGPHVGPWMQVPFAIVCVEWQFTV